MSLQSSPTEAINNKHLISIITSIINEIIIDQIHSKGKMRIIEKQKKISFHSDLPVRISIKAYIERILKFTHCEESSLIIGLIYIDKVCEMAKLIITPNNIHRLLFIAIISAIKYNEDECYTNSYYAKVGGISLSEINRLEFDLLKLIKYSLFVSDANFLQYKQYLVDYTEMI